MKKQLIGIASSVALATTLAVAAPAPANAALTCPGTYVTEMWIRAKNTDQTVLGKVGVFRDGATWCAVLIKKGPVYGVATDTTIIIMAHPKPGSGLSSRSDYDSGKFRYQTDAVTVKQFTGGSIFVSAATKGLKGNWNQVDGFVR